MNTMDRRAFLASAAAVPFVSAMSSGSSQRAPRNPVAVSSANGIPAVTEAARLIRLGSAPVDAVVAGVTIVENDPQDMSVGYGGLPNEHGVVQLDASVMDGPNHKAGAVGALENIRNPARVALEVLRRTDHVLLVGAGALEFAKAVGFQEENLLTDRARKAWLKWKANLNPRDDLLDDDQRVKRGSDIPFTDGTVHVSAVDTNGDLGSCTTTSGLSYKLNGRVGDSPIVGAGMFCDNEVGAAGSTGRGESVIQSAGAFQVVRNMADGMEPTEACLRVLKWIADHSKRPDLLDPRGEPRFQVTMYALRKDGVYGAACMRKGKSFVVHDGTAARKEQCPYLYE